LLFQPVGRSLGHQRSLIEDRQPIAFVGFFENVGGEQDGDALFSPQQGEVLPEIQAGAGIDAGAGLVEEQQLRAMHESFR
jgi:hypothetical protein